VLSSGAVLTPGR